MNEQDENRPNWFEADADGIFRVTRWTYFHSIYYLLLRPQTRNCLICIPRRSHHVIALYGQFGICQKAVDSASAELCAPCAAQPKQKVEQSRTAVRAEEAEKSKLDS